MRAKHDARPTSFVGRFWRWHINFYLMFRRIVDRYRDRIAALPEKVKIWQTFPTRGWILLVFMMGLGIALKHIPGVPSTFTASFYTGLRPMLLLSAGRYLLKSGRNVTL